jgi:succinyl-CoA synthetase beta subunit
MHIHEYQAKELLKNNGIPVPEFIVASSVDEVKKNIDSLNLNEAVLKIQVHAGGRGKAGGVKFAKNKNEILALSNELIGMKIVNQQTGPDGLISKKILISSSVSIKKEFYIGATIDRKKGQAVLILSDEGGMEIEEIAEKNPDKILKLPIPIDGKLKGYHLMRAINFFKFKNDLAKKASKIIYDVALLFKKYDCSLLEINPFVQTENDELFAVDAKMTIDDNAMFRQIELANYFDPTQQSTSEVKAKEFDLAYIPMDGDIGCMVNGAGLAMATMDIIKLRGKDPANFLDVGGGASKEKVAAGFRIILSDPKVKAILINIFGGIMNCEILAQGIIQAANELKIDVPLIVRMEGTHVDEAKKLLEESKLAIHTAKSLDEAALLVVKYAKE